MKEQDLADGQVNAMIGTALGLGFVSPKQFPYFAIIFLFCTPFILKNPMQGLLIFSCIYGFFWVLTGNDPSRFLERLGRPKRYIAEEPCLDFNQAGIPLPKKGRRAMTTYRVKGKKRKHYHIEQKFHFLTYGQVELDGKKTGFYLLRRGPQLMFIFGWEVGGYDPSMTGPQAFSILSSCNNALNSLPSDIDLKIYQDVERTCEDYLQMQARLFKLKDRDPLSRELIRSRAKRARDLTEEGRLLNTHLRFYAKYRVPLGGDYAVTQSWLDDLLSKTQPLVSGLKKGEFDSEAAWENAILYAYRYAYQKVNSLLSANTGFGMRVRTLTVDNFWEKDYLEVHVPPVPEIPQYIVYNESGLQYPVVNEIGTHSLGVLFESQNGISPLPRFDRHHLYLPGKDCYAAFVRLGQMRLFPKDKESVARGYLRFLSNILSGTARPIYDSRVVCELTPDRSGFEMIQLDRIISNSVKREALAAKKQTVDVVAMRRREQAIDARDLLEEGDIPYWCSVGIWLYRDNLEQINQDISDLIDRVPNGAVERVEHDVEDVWFQTWTFEWESFLTKPNHRRQKYLGYQALPMVPLVKVKPAEKKGMLVIARELNSPIYIDIANRKNHTAVIAKSGSGKSILMLEPILEHLLYDHLSVIFDFPRPDGSSTYTVLVPLLEKLGVKAAYHNVRESVMNIIEMPDLRHLKSEKDRRSRQQEAFQNHVRLLCAIVMGLAENPDRETLVVSLLTDCYADFQANPEISERYRLAIEGGFGTDAYQRMPILKDFVAYAENWFADYIDKKKDRISNLVNDTIDLIVTQLRGVLRTPLGASIDGISSFDTNVSVLVIGLTNVAENLDSLIYAMSGLNVLYRGTLSAKRSLLAIDEGTVLFKFTPFARETGIIPVHGRKWGCNFLVAAQEIATIMRSCSGNEIFKNLDNIFCGHIEDTAIPEMVELNFRQEILSNYSSEASKPSHELTQSYWYLKRGDQHLEVTHPPSELILALGATDPDEDAARKRIMAQYPDDEVLGIKQFASNYIQARRQGLSMDSITVNNLPLNPTN